eukprot:Lithocolla_globosa_v1_NODE_255_length_4802_cov_69.795660.p1 type:complete len:651 gc:universal NODE_255_length_4802_cov_69.795660:2633-4585(+)
MQIILLNLLYQPINYTLMKSAVEELDIGQSVSAQRYKVANAIDRSRLMVIRCVNLILSQQELSAQQVISYLVGYPDHYTSHTFQRLYWNDIDGWATRQEDPSLDDKERFKLSQVPEEEDEFSDDDNAGEVKPLVQHNQRLDYMYRGQELEDMSVYEFVANVSKISSASETKRLKKISASSKHKGRAAEPRYKFQKEHPQCLTHLLKRHPVGFNVVPELCGKSFPIRPTVKRELETEQDKKLWEKYARAVLLLFTPWRNYSDLREDDETWRDAYDRCSLNDVVKRVLKNIQLLHDSKDSKDKDQALRKERKKVIGKGKPLDLDELAQLHEMANATKLDVNLQTQQLREKFYSQNAEMCAAACGWYPHERNHVFGENAHPTDFRRGDVHDAQRSKQWGKDIDAAREERIVTMNLPVDMDAENAGERYQYHGGDNDKLPEIYKGSDTKGYDQLMKEISDFFKLDTDQHLAFKIITTHAEKTGPKEEVAEQLRMYVGGAAGTGKSQIINACVMFFELRGLRQTLRLAAPTGSASALIDGNTIDSLLCESWDTKGKNLKLTASEALEKKWAGVNYLFIDEVSMIGQTKMAKLHAKLCQATSTTNPGQPFAGINVVFFGDLMAQLIWLAKSSRLLNPRGLVLQLWSLAMPLIKVSM